MISVLSLNNIFKYCWEFCSNIFNHILWRWEKLVCSMRAQYPACLQGYQCPHWICGYEDEWVLRVCTFSGGSVQWGNRHPPHLRVRGRKTNSPSMIRPNLQWCYDYKSCVVILLIMTKAETSFIVDIFLVVGTVRSWPAKLQVGCHWH